MPAVGPELPPFLPGQYMEARATGATTEAQLVGQEYEGKEYWFLDYNWAATGGIKPLRSNIPRKLRIVRNCSGYSLRPRRLIHLGLVQGGAATGDVHAGYGSASSYTAIQPTTGPSALTRIAGYARLSNEQAWPLDEFLPSGGVPHGALCYIVVQGPAMCETDGADLLNGEWFGPVATLTTAAATVVAGTGGRLGTALSLTTTALALSQHLCLLGRALSSGAAAAGDQVLINVTKVW